MKAKKLVVSALILSMLCSLLMGVGVMADNGEASVTAVTQTVYVDGKAVNAEIYSIDGCSYFKLRDVAAALNGTPAQFSVSFNADDKTVSTQRSAAYQAVGGELAASADKSKSCVSSEWTLYVDGGEAQLLSAYDIGGNNYFKLNDLACLYGFGVSYDESNRQISIDSSAGYSLEFDDSAYVIESVNVYGETVEYKTYTVTYVSEPNAVTQQMMKIYVPLTATENSPIFMPLTTGAYRHVTLNTPLDVDETNINESSTGTAGTGGMHAASVLLSKGYVVVSAAARGRNTAVEVDGNTSAVGTAPACVTDLKAAIRYLKYNDASMLGDADKIIVTGTSGGGAMTSILGTSGNSEYCTPYLEEIGAAMTMPDGVTKITDDIFAAAPYCPITDIDNANNAYEWLFYGAEVTNRENEDGVLAEEMAKLFVSYVNGLGLCAEDGLSLTLNSYDSDTAMGGTYKDYLFSMYANGLTDYMHENGYVNTDGTLNSAGTAYMNAKFTDKNGNALDYAPADIFRWDSSTASASVMADAYTAYISIMAAKTAPKSVASFDSGFTTQNSSEAAYTGENIVFGAKLSDLNDWNHFDMNLGAAIINANTALGAEFYKSAKNSFTVSDAVQRLAAMYNPMYYIADYSGVASNGLSVNKYADDMLGSGTVAQNWHIRVGSWDRDTTTTVSLNLSLALASYGADVDYSVYWDQPHCGWYDNTDLISWIEGICRS